MKFNKHGWPLERADAEWSGASSQVIIAERPPYVSLQGHHPVLIIGLRAYQLFGAPRGIGVLEAMLWAGV